MYPPEHSPNRCTPQVWIGLCEYFSDNVRKPPFWPIFSHFGHYRAKMRPTSPKSKSFLNTHPISVHHKFQLDCVNTVSYNGWKPTILVHFQYFLATRGPKFATKANQTWTPTQQMSSPNLKWIEPWLFQIMVGNTGGTHGRTGGRSPFLCSYKNVSESARVTSTKYVNVVTFFTRHTIVTPGYSSHVAFVTRNR